MRKRSDGRRCETCVMCRRGQRGDTQERQLRVRSPRRPEKELEARKSPPRRQPSSGEGGLDAAPVRPSEVVEPEGGRVGSQQRLSAAPARSTGLRADRARNKHPAVTEPRHGVFQVNSLTSPHLNSHEFSFCPAGWKLTQECRNLLIRCLSWKET